MKYSGEIEKYQPIGSGKFSSPLISVGIKSSKFNGQVFSGLLELYDDIIKDKEFNIKGIFVIHYIK